MDSPPVWKNAVTPLNSFFEKSFTIRISYLWNELFSILLIFIMLNLVPHGQFVLGDWISTNSSFNELFLGLNVSLFWVYFLFIN
jgi:hypothetical protein